MPPKKAIASKVAPKKSAKKTAPKKTAPKKAAPKKAAKKGAAGRGQDLRRCYEHFGRIVALQPLISEAKTLGKLTAMAQELVRRNDLRNAADLLRAGEHLCFGTLAFEAPGEPISEVLTLVMKAEVAGLLERAGHHADAGTLSSAVEKLYSTTRREALKALKAQKLRAASELARGAEALSHVSADFTGRLRSADRTLLQLP